MIKSIIVIFVIILVSANYASTCDLVNENNGTVFGEKGSYNVTRGECPTNGKMVECKITEEHAGNLSDNSSNKKWSCNFISGDEVKFGKTKEEAVAKLCRCK